MEEISVPSHPGFTVTNMEGDTTSSGGWRGDASSRFSLCVYFYGTQSHSHVGLSAGNVDSFAPLLKGSTAVERGLHLPKGPDMPGSSGGSCLDLSG